MKRNEGATSTTQRARAGLLAFGACILLFAPVALAEGSPLPFKPGHYAGHTSQTCPADPVPAGACQAGQKLPVSFTVTGHAIRRLSVPVVERCESPQPVVHTMSYPPKDHGSVKITTDLNVVAPKARRAPFAIRQGFQEGDAGIGDDGLTGTIRKTSASGRLASLITVNSSGQLDGQGGDSCFTFRPVHWQARRISP